MFSTCPYNMVNFGWDRFGSLGHPSKFQRVSRLTILTAATSLTGGQPIFARCLVVSWAGTLYIHFRGLLPPDRILPGAKFTFTSKPCVRLYWQRYCTALQQRASAKLCGAVQRMELQNFRRECHLYSAGRPSRLTSIGPHSSSTSYSDLKGLLIIFIHRNTIGSTQIEK